MPATDLRYSSVNETLRAEQHRAGQLRAGKVSMAGLFDVPLEDKTTVSWDYNLQVEDKPWNVGLVIGPSGSGKSGLARHLWPDRVVTEYDWPVDRLLLDGFPPELGIKDVTGRWGRARVAARLDTPLPRSFEGGGVPGDVRPRARRVRGLGRHRRVHVGR